MDLILEKDVVSLTDFARQTRKHTAELKKTKRPRVLTHNGKAAAVVMSVAAFDEMAEAAHEHQMDLRLKAALEVYVAGDRGTPGAEAFAQIRERAAKRRTK
jgi:PHD/YefM family antitoxin component YafN of YafNO toxin-antitoxin module